MKIVDIARGLTVLAMGSFSSSSGTFEFDTDELDGADFGIFLTEFGTAERVDQPNYHQTLVTSAGTRSCGAGCTPARHEYDEFFRMNARRSDGSLAMLFHRNRAITHKTSLSTFEMFT